MLDIDEDQQELELREVPGERGASMVEYALLLALIAVIAVGAVSVFGVSLGSEYSQMNSTIELNVN